MKPREKNNRIIGIDPGSIFCGYGIVDRKRKDEIEYIVSGRIELRKRDPLHERLRDLHASLKEIIREFNPHVAVIERVFFAKGIKAALNLGHARGVSLLTASEEGLEIYEYSALEVKKAVVGYGRADKSQVMSMVRGILNMKHDISEDSADALALALCHMNTIDIHSVTR